MSVPFAITPTNGHLPPSLEPILGADEKVLSFDFGWGIMTCILEELAHMCFELSDIGVALSRPFMSQGDGDLENRDYDGVRGGIDGE